MANVCYSALIVFLIFTGSGYLTLRFLSRLFGVDMVAAMCWGFRGDDILAITVGWCLFYFIGFSFTATLLMKTATLWNINATHDAGLRGYMLNVDHAKLYDPRKREYVKYEIAQPQHAAGRFDKTFDLITVYRPYQSGPYQDIWMQNIWLSVFFTVVAALGLVMTYVLSYTLAGEYIRHLNLAQELSHALVLARFQEMTGYSFSLVLTVVLFLIILTSGIGGYLENRITNDYEEQFSETQKEFREEILYRVKPGMILRGRLVNRTEDQEKVTDASSTDSDGKTEYSYTYIDKTMYTVEFKGIIRSEPVYLLMTYFGKIGDIPDVQFLDRYFPRLKSSLENTSASYITVDADGAGELDFLVKDDYSIAPVRE